MIWFILMQICGLMICKNLDWYRSLNCLSLSFRGIYCLAQNNWVPTQNNVQSSLSITCKMYISYILVDITQIKLTRPELLLHHVFTMVAYILLSNRDQYYYDCLMAHVFLVAELLSVCNGLLRERPMLLRYWRSFILICVRIPIWIYLNYMVYYTHQLDTNIMYNIGGVCMPLLDCYFLSKI